MRKAYKLCSLLRDEQLVSFIELFLSSLPIKKTTFAIINHLYHLI